MQQPVAFYLQVLLVLLDDSHQMLQSIPLPFERLPTTVKTTKSFESYTKVHTPVSSGSVTQDYIRWV